MAAHAGPRHHAHSSRARSGGARGCQMRHSSARLPPRAAAAWRLKCRRHARSLIKLPTGCVAAGCMPATNCCVGSWQIQGACLSDGAPLRSSASRTAGGGLMPPTRNQQSVPILPILPGSSHPQHATARAAVQAQADAEGQRAGHCRTSRAAGGQPSDVLLNGQLRQQAPGERRAGRHQPEPPLPQLPEPLTGSPWPPPCRELWQEAAPEPCGVPPPLQGIPTAAPPPPPHADADVQQLHPHQRQQPQPQGARSGTKQQLPAVPPPWSTERCIEQPNEAERLAAVRALNLIGAPPKPCFDAVTT